MLSGGDGPPNVIAPRRRTEQTTFDHVPVHLLCGVTYPDHATICAFRCGLPELGAHEFEQVEPAARCEVPKVGNVTVAPGGTKVLANTSKRTTHRRALRWTPV